MINRVKGWILAATVLLCAQAGAASLSDIQVSNGDSQARITFSFMGDPEYAFSQIDSRSVALDIKQSGVIQGLPLQFSGNNLVKRAKRRRLSSKTAPVIRWFLPLMLMFRRRHRLHLW